MIPRPLLAAAAVVSLTLNGPARGQDAAPEKDTKASDVKAPDAKPLSGHAAFLKDVAIPVRTIDPKDEDFSDLMPLIEKIGSARVVLLGEQSHGDGSCFQGKSRLIRFLHQKMGFEVLAFESGMFDMRWVDEGMRNGAPLTEVHKRGLFGIWALSAQCQDLLKYALDSNSTENPLEFAGFDNQFSSGEARQEFPRAVKAFFGKAGDAFPKDVAQPAADLSDWMERSEVEARDPDRKRKAKDPKPIQDRVAELIKLIEEKKDVLLRVHSPRDVAFMKRCLSNQIEFSKQLVFFQHEDEMSRGGTVRDTAMGSNLTWLVTEYYSGRKVIVWAASMHNMYNAPQASLLGSQVSYKDTITMGHVAHGLIGDMMYSIMFIADRGRTGMPWSQPGPIGKPPKDSIDALMHETGLPLAFLDLKTAAAKDGGAWLKERQVARPLGYANCEAVWTDQCDAFFFTDEMKPSTMRQP
jgi:erythromycin esterase